MDGFGLFDRPILIVSGKGGTGKSTVAAGLAAAGAARGLRTLLVEVEGRGEVTRTLGVEDPGYHERATPLGCSVLSVTPREAAFEYFRLFVGFDRMVRALLGGGFFEQVVGAAPGLRDLLIGGKLYEIAALRGRDERVADRPAYDVVVVDGPPTGQIVPFLGAGATFAGLVAGGRVRRQAAAIDRMFRERSHVVLVSLAEEMAVAETAEAIPALRSVGVPVAAVVANGLQPAVFPRGTARAASRLSPPDVARIAGGARLALDPGGAHRLLEGARAGDERRRSQRALLRRLAGAGLLLEVEEVPGAQGTGLVRAVARRLDPRGEHPPKGAVERRGAVPGRGRGRALPREGLGPHVAGARILVVVGPGGVGKTTLSAALALRLAAGADRPVLLTVDPARRLAAALRLPMGEGQRTFLRVGEGRRLEAMQLDTQRTFDELVERYAGTPGRRDRILGNRFYRRIADTLSGTHEYMAMEKLYELAAEEAHGLIVVDTPPTRSAVSFLEAPQRLTDFLGGRFLRLLRGPTARAGRITFGLARAGTGVAARTLGRVVGAQTLADAAEFLSAFEGMYGGFAERAARVQDLLRSPDCAFVVATAPAGPRLEEAAFLVARLRSGGMRAAAVVVNRWHPEAAGLPRGIAEAARALENGGPEERAVAAILGDRIRREPLRVAEDSAMAGFAAGHPDVPLIAVPELGGEVRDVPGLRRLAGHLFADAPPGAQAPLS